MNFVPKTTVLILVRRPDKKILVVRPSLGGWSLNEQHAPLHCLCVNAPQVCLVLCLTLSTEYKHLPSNHVNRVSLQTLELSFEKPTQFSRGEKLRIDLLAHLALFILDCEHIVYIAMRVIRLRLAVVA